MKKTAKKGLIDFINSIDVFGYSLSEKDHKLVIEIDVEEITEMNICLACDSCCNPNQVPVINAPVTNFVFAGLNENEEKYCVNPKTRIVRKNTTFIFSCEAARRNEKLCGKAGKLFKKKSIISKQYIQLTD